MRKKLQVAFWIAAGFLGGVLTSYAVPKVIDPVLPGYRRIQMDAQDEPLLLTTAEGVKVGELRFSQHGCAISAERGVMLDIRRIAHGSTVVLHTRTPK
jgi:hypothetical protein